MSYTLSRETQVTIIRALVEGCSIRSVERMTEVHRDTIMRLMVRIGEGCERLQDRMMRDLDCEAIEIDEVWGYVAKKQRNVNADLGDVPSEVGDAWTFVAIDADTKLVPAFLTGKRTAACAQAFIADLSKRLRNRVQISSDGLALYPESIEQAFGCAVDYAQIVKSYTEEPGTSGRYSPARVKSTEKFVIAGTPDVDRVSTSYVERHNLSTRMTNRRMTRLTNAFSKKLANHKAMMALTFANYNLCRTHRTLRMTPAMAANVTDHIWTVAELVDAAVAA